MTAKFEAKRSVQHETWTAIGDVPYRMSAQDVNGKPPLCATKQRRLSLSTQRLHGVIALTFFATNKGVLCYSCCCCCYCGRRRRHYCCVLIAIVIIIIKIENV